MNTREICKIIEVVPRSKTFSAEELTKYRNVKMEPVRVGLKRVHPSDTNEEQKELSRLHAELKKQISMPRIDRLDGRALAEWDTQKRAVCVKRKDGKFENFGYSHEGKFYLEYYEALFLLELGRLQLERHDQILSLEQAYLLLLDEDASPKFNEYLVYSNFMRVGYILVKHENLTHGTMESTEENECIWALLFEALQNKSIASNIVQSTHFHRIKESMEDIKRRIQGQQHQQKQSSNESLLGATRIINFQCKIQSNRKRKAADMRWNNRSKRHCCQPPTMEQYKNSSFLDLLKREPEYERFRKIFEKFDIIKLKSETSESTMNCQKLRIHFDVYLYNDGFRRSSPNVPSFRLVFLESTFPTNTEIFQCYNQQKLKVPLLIVSISESKQIHAFLYYFT